MQQKISPLKALRFLHKTMMLGMLLFTVIVIFVELQHPGEPIDPTLGKALQVVALALSIGGIAAGFMLFKTQLQTMDLADTAVNRIAVYREGCHSPLGPYRSACFVFHHLFQDNRQLCFPGIGAGPVVCIWCGATFHAGDYVSTEADGSGSKRTGKYFRIDFPRDPRTVF